MGGFLLPRIAGVRCEGMIERLAVDILGVRRKMRLQRSRRLLLKRYGIR